jgi:hypothetical protein
MRVWLQDTLYITACLQMQTRCNAVAPDTARCSIQKAWDVPLVNRKREEMISAAQTQAERARLIVAAASYSGEFLQAVPCSAVGMRRCASLSLFGSAPIYVRLICAYVAYVKQVDTNGTHGLACRKSASRHMQHNGVNDLIKRPLVSANVPAMLEPISLS